MTKDDVENLFKLLKIYFPNSRRCENQTLKAAWLRLLEPYAPETVKEALTSLLRENENFPDPQKIAVRCQAAKPVQNLVCPSSTSKDLIWMLPYIHKMAAQICEQEANCIHAAGLQTWQEAEAQGVPFPVWNRGYWEAFPTGMEKQKCD